MTETLIGIFVGGGARRMGGIAKGLLSSPDGRTTLVERLRDVAELALPGARVALVGFRPEYAGLKWPFLSDDPAGVGPIGGLCSLLAAASPHQAIALACDLPAVSAALLARLAAHQPGAAAVAPRIHGVWQPLCARYDSAVLPIARRLVQEERYALQGIFEALGKNVAELPLSNAEQRQLRDWDTPDDIGD